MGFNLSYWEKKNFFDADVIIVGAGIVGLNAALTLKYTQPKLNIIVLERGFLPNGASTKNAGFACFGSVSELIEQEKSAGTDGLHQLIAKRWNGLLKMRNLLGDGKIAYHNYGGYELFRSTQYNLASECVAKLSHFNNLIADIVGRRDVFVQADDKIKTFGFKNVNVLLENKLEAQIDPGQMMKALSAKCFAQDIKIYTSCTVEQLQHEGNIIHIRTAQGTFRANRVLLTNNAFISSLMPDLAVVPGRGQVVVTNPISNLKIKGTFHYDKGYYYFRNVDNRILLGGGRNLDFEAEQTTEFGSTALVQNALNNLLKEVIIPDVDFKIEHSWSGIMAFGPKLDPIIEEVQPNIFAAVRCNGMGIAIGSQTGEDAAKMLLNTLS